MKTARLVNLIVIAAILAVVGTGCRRGPGYVTPLPGKKPGAIKDIGSAEPLTGAEGTGGGITGTPVVGSEGIPATDSSIYDNWKQDAEVLKQYTVYFAYDSSAIQTAERSKLEAVAEYLKTHTSPRTAVKVEGHCDERGTEEYNRALGDRRALSAREEIVAAGIDPSRIITVSYGEDRPAVPQSTPEAWAKNRRAEFILLTEP